MTVCTGHIGNTFHFFVGGVDAVEREFGYLCLRYLPLPMSPGRTKKVMAEGTPLGSNRLRAGAKLVEMVPGIILVGEGYWAQNPHRYNSIT